MPTLWRQGEAVAVLPRIVSSVLCCEGSAARCTGSEYSSRLAEMDMVAGVTVARQDLFSHRQPSIGASDLSRLALHDPMLTDASQQG